MKAAKSLNITLIPRAEMLSSLMRDFKVLQLQALMEKLPLRV